MWDNIALTDDERKATEALNLVTSSKVDGVAMVASAFKTHGFGRLIRPMGRRVVVKTRNQARPVALESFGDGAIRMFGIAMAVANTKSGFLLLDEVENGIHHSVQYDFWRLVLNLADAYDTQVFATTHS